MMNKRPCKFGPNCKEYQQNKCTFGHDQSSEGGGGNPGFGGSKPTFGKPPGGVGGGGKPPGFGGGMGAGGAPKECNRGTECHFWKIGKCNFYHPVPYQGSGMEVQGNPIQGMGQGAMGQQYPQQQYPQQQQQQIQQGMQGATQQGMGQGSNPGMNPKQGPNQGGRCKYGNDCRRFKQGKCNLDHSGPALSKSQQYCKFWQKGNCVKQNCRNHHAFSIDGSVERVYYTDAFPTHPKSGIGCITMETNHFLVPRMGNGVYSLLYQAGSEEIQPQQFQLQVEDIIYQSKVEGSWILLAFEKNKFHNIQAYNLQTQQNIVIEKAHQKHITGLAMYDDTSFLSSSLDNENPIKMWTLQGDTFAISPQHTKALSGQINNPKADIYFIKVINFGGSKCIAAGTSDGRVLLWKDGSFMTLQIPIDMNPSYVNVFDFDIQPISQVPCGFILAWSSDKQKSGIFIINLTSIQTVMPFHAQNSPMTKMLITRNSWMVTANINNEVNFYKIQISGEPGQEGPHSVKAGTAAFDNSVAEILYMEATTPTLISMKNVLVMENCREMNNINANNETAKGSVSIFKIE